jgi:hypothetical protein
MSRPIDPSKTATTHKSLKKTSSHKSTSTAATSVHNTAQSNSQDHGQPIDNSTFRDPLLGVGSQFGIQGGYSVPHYLSTSNLFTVFDEKAKSHSSSKGDKSKYRHNLKKSNTRALVSDPCLTDINHR